MRLQCPNVLDDFIDLHIGESGSERGHGSVLAVLDLALGQLCQVDALALPPARMLLVCGDESSAQSDCYPNEFTTSPSASASWPRSRVARDVTATRTPHV